MSWALKGLSGPLKNKTIPLRTGLTLGRQGEVVIADTKASSIHARISQSAQGKWLIEDNNSKNGTRVKGERITREILTRGLVFYIGDVGFEVIELANDREEAPKADLTATVVMAPSPAPEPTSTAAAPEPTAPAVVAEPPAPPPKKKRTWNEILASFVQKHFAQFADRPRPVTPLEPALVLDFVRGIQANSHWIVGYGPRKVGATCLDLPIWEPGCPAICFEILPSSEGIVFKTAHADLVRLNGQSVDSQVLRVGDTIRILETQIEVDFVQ